MLRSLTAWIRRRHWLVRILAWPAYLVIWVVYHLTRSFFQTLGWALHEMGTRAKAKAKRVFAPLLWPILAVLVVAGLFALGPPQETQALLTNIIALGIVVVGLRVMVAGIWPMGKKKKK